MNTRGDHQLVADKQQQTIYTKMVDIAERFPESKRQKYRDAAQDFRLPFWDYFRTRGRRLTVFPGRTLDGGKTSFPWDFSIPQIFTVPEIVLRTPDNDELKLCPNPMIRFRFPVKGSIPEKQWSTVIKKDVSGSSKVMARFF